MFGITRRLRRWLEAPVRRSLARLEGGFLLTGQDPAGTPKLQSCSLEVAAYRFGLLPIFRVREGRSLSLAELIGPSLQAAQNAFVGELGRAPEVTRLHADTVLTNSAKQRIGRVRAKAADEVATRLGAFDREVLARLITEDRNGFRKQLLEKLGSTAADTFANIAKRAIAELVLRTREECLQEGLLTNGGEAGDDELALPTGTRFVRRRGKMTVFVIEQPPTKRTVQVQAAEGAPAERYELSLPFVVFFVALRQRQFDKLYVLFRTEPLRSLDDTLRCPAFSNVYADFSVCFRGPKTAEQPAETAEAAIDSFWGGRFVLTHAPNYTNQISLREWEQRSEQDALFGISYQWREAKQTVASLLEAIGKNFAAEAKKRRPGEVKLSALEACVDRLAEQVARQMQEAAFFLLPRWTLDSRVLEEAQQRFTNVIEEVCAVVRTELEKSVDGLVSDATLKRAFQKATERAVESLRANTGAAVAAAHDALTRLL